VQEARAKLPVPEAQAKLPVPEAQAKLPVVMLDGLVLSEVEPGSA